MVVSVEVRAKSIFLLCVFLGPIRPEVIGHFESVQMAGLTSDSPGLSYSEASEDFRPDISVNLEDT